MSINEKIFNLLEKKNLKQSDLAKHLNVRNSVITAWKTRGNNPPVEYLVQICEFLDVSVYDMLEIKSENVKNDVTQISENEAELLSYFNYLPEREQIKWIARIEDAAKPYMDEATTQSKIS